MVEEEGVVIVWLFFFGFFPVGFWGEGCRGGECVGVCCVEGSSAAAGEEERAEERGAWKHGLLGKSVGACDGTEWEVGCVR